MDKIEKINSLRLINTPQIGGVNFRRLINKYGNANEAIKAVKVLWERKGLEVCSVDFAEAEIKKADEKGIRILFWKESDFPKKFLEIADLPPIIYVLGNVRALSNKSIAMVGSRNASVNSRNLTFNISKELSEKNITVVSGLALGIDTAAHEGALAGGGSFPTVAVLAGGVDVIYPLRNKDIYKSIIENGGAIVSENLINAKPIAANFPRRNKLISGLACSVCVMEANEKSGSLITAKYAQKQKKSIFAVPANPLNPQANGTNMLLKSGANMLMSASDILENINNEMSSDLFDSINEDSLSFEDELEVDKLEDKNIENEILSMLSENPISLHEIIEKSSLNKKDIISHLLLLELDGKIISENSNMYSRVF
ncbi:MAG: DNA-processing protein DprA [Alphaproteobacteria bacterium]|jgi:DNA processing protein|nr:DNA-processing protein DprA [Alphaproteobacteria bacterium]